MTGRGRGRFVQCAAGVTLSIGLVAVPLPASSQGLPGVSDNEIRIGHTGPYTGPVSAWGEIGRVIAAYFEMINDYGGINGRHVEFISYDDATNPAVTLQQTRRLVEQDDVLLIFQSLGVTTNLAIRDYLNNAGVPQLFIAAGNEEFDDPDQYPWTMRWQPSYHAEGRAYARYIEQNFEGAILGVLYQDDSLGANYLAVLNEELGDRFTIVAQPYDLTDPTVDAQIAALQAAEADLFLNLAGVRQAPMAIRRAEELGWDPQMILTNISSSIETVLIPSGVENAIGAVTALAGKNPTDPAWKDDEDVIAYTDFLRDYFPTGDLDGGYELYAYQVASAFTEVLRRCGDDLSRENVMRQATSLTNQPVPLALPGITLTTSPTDYAPIEQLQLHRFDGTRWVPFGEVLDLSE